MRQLFVWSTFVCSLLIVAHSVTYAEPLLTDFIDDTSLIAVEQLRPAKAMIDKHIVAIKNIVERIEKMPNEEQAKMTNALTNELEPLAKEEAKVFQTLSPKARLEVYRYGINQMNKAKPSNLGAPGFRPEDDGPTLHKRYIGVLNKASINAKTDVLSDEEFLRLFSKEISVIETECRAVTVGTPYPCKRAMCIGFIVGYRKCCGGSQPGNGVCGGPPVDCYHSDILISDSCPSFTCVSP